MRAEFAKVAPVAVFVSLTLGLPEFLSLWLGTLPKNLHCYEQIQKTQKDLALDFVDCSIRFDLGISYKTRDVAHCLLLFFKNQPILIRDGER